MLCFSIAYFYFSSLRGNTKIRERTKVSLSKKLLLSRTRIDQLKQLVCFFLPFIYRDTKVTNSRHLSSHNVISTGHRLPKKFPEETVNIEDQK